MKFYSVIVFVNIITYICHITLSYSIILISSTNFSYNRFTHETQHVEFIEPLRRIREPIELQKISNRTTIPALNQLDQLNNLVSTTYIIFTYNIAYFNTNHLYICRIQDLQ